MEAKLAMTSFPFEFDNSDPRILTILVIGTEEKVRGYIQWQHQKGFAEVGAWSEIIPVPNCPGKYMSLLNKNIS
ncbi:MAG: hypothetical protein HC865_19475 [Cyanobacteria bacterium RU_5_0]|nr:hypothetical protein [Cyanobacteria bacterium RU_5_0]